MYARILKPSKQSFFLFGPRGTGKSSWVKKEFPQAICLDLLDSEVYTHLLASPNRLKNYLPLSFDQRTQKVIIDEVQKVPEILNEVHRLIESEKIQFILTGSSARKLRREGVNLLAGRALMYSMHPFTAQELGDDFDLKFALQWGMLPALYGDADPQKYLKSYVQTYLREEVFQEGLTRNLPAFSRFLEAASFSQGSTLNLTSVAEDCSMPRKTIEGYFKILEDLLIGIRVPCFTRKAKRKIMTHPKFYFFDNGVFRTLRPRGPLDTGEEIEGPSLETLVFQELRALNAYLDLDYSLNYWKTYDQLEVDIVLYGENGLKVFEIKRSNRIRNSDLKGLKAFISDYPMAKAYLLYSGDRKMWEEKISILPITEFFKTASQILTS